MKLHPNPRASLHRPRAIAELDPYVKPILVEAEGTKELILRRLQERYPCIPEQCELADAILQLRRNGPDGANKTLIIVDQFEQ